MEKYFKFLCISHEDFDPYLSFAVDFNEDMSLVFIFDASHLSNEECNYVGRIVIDKTNTSLLALNSHIAIPELSDFFYNKFKVEDCCIDPDSVLKVCDDVAEYLYKHHIKFEYVTEPKIRK